MNSLLLLTPSSAFGQAVQAKTDSTTRRSETAESIDALAASFSKAASPSPATETPQIKISIKQIRLSSELRNQVYQSDPATSRQTTLIIPDSLEPLGSDAAQLHASALNPLTIGTEDTVSASTIVSNLVQKDSVSSVTPITRRLTSFKSAPKTMLPLMERLKAGGALEAWTPTVITLDDDQATLDSRASQPFVVGFEIQKNTPVPVVRQIPSGNRIQVKPKRINESSFHLQLSWTFSEINQVDKDQVYLKGFDPLEIQVPRQRQHLTTIAEDVQQGQWLWVDPHLRVPARQTENKPTFAARLATWSRRKPAESKEDYLILIVRAESL